MRKQRGQTLVLVSLMMVVLLGLTALAIDGGNAYLQRRQAQTAADAGALAAAKALCSGQGDPAQEMQTYCMDRNGADLCKLTLIDGRRVQVDSTITVPTWFAGIVGVHSVTAVARAGAACSPPAGLDNLLPLAVMVPMGSEDWDESFSTCGTADVCDLSCSQYELWDKEDKDVKESCDNLDPTVDPPPQCEDGSGAFGYIDWSQADGYETPEDCTCEQGGAADTVCYIKYPECAPFLIPDDDWDPDDDNEGWYNFPEPGASQKKDIFETLSKWWCCEHVTVPIVNARRGTGNTTEYHLVGFGEFVLTGVCRGKDAYTCGLPMDCSDKMSRVRGYFVDWVEPGMGDPNRDDDLGIYTVHLLH